MTAKQKWKQPLVGMAESNRFAPDHANTIFVAASFSSPPRTGPAVTTINQSPRKNLADDVFNRHFLNVYVSHGQIIEQGFAGGDDAVALDL